LGSWCATAATDPARDQRKRTQRDIVSQDGFVDLLHLAQFGFPDIFLGLDALDAHLTAQIRIFWTYPDHATEDFLAAAFDGDDVAFPFGSAQAYHARTPRRDVVGAAHLDPRTVLLVPISDADRQCHVDSFVEPIKHQQTGQRLVHSTS